MLLGSDPRLANRMGLALDWSEPAKYEPFPRKADFDGHAAANPTLDTRVGPADVDATADASSKPSPLAAQETAAAPPALVHRSVHKAVALEERRRAQDDGLPLSKCLDAFTRAEALTDDVWSCDQCKQSRLATRTLSLWALPDVMVVHLSRFYYTSHSKEKLTALVQFPVRGLDMSPWVNSHHRHGEPRRKAAVYDLFGVVNHMGGLGGGHYTAYVQMGGSAVGEPARWFSMNDATVTEVADEASVVTKFAYLLFYRKREMSAHNLVNFSR